MHCKCNERPYISRYASNILIRRSPNELSLGKDLENLWSIIPNSIDLATNCDLVAATLNAVVGNISNKNFDCVSNATLVSIAPNFLWKFVDVEHDSNKCIGVICSYGFSEFGTNKLISEAEALTSAAPVNLSLGVLIWGRALSESYLNTLINSQNTDNDNYSSLSASWEIEFKDYDIAVGPTINLADCKIYSGEEKNAFEKYLPWNEELNKKKGGKGKTEDGQFVFRVILNKEKGDALPTGIGLVENPAAFVKGLSFVDLNMKTTATAKSLEDFKEKLNEAFEKALSEFMPFTKKEDDKSEEEPKNDSTDKEDQDEDKEHEDKETKEEEDKESKEDSEAKSVLQENNKTKAMSLKNIKDITDENLKQAKASEVLELFQNSITEAVTKANEEYVSELNAKKTILSELETGKAETESKLTEALAKITDLETKYNQLLNSAIAKEVEDNFQKRMAQLDETYNLTDKLSEIVAGKVKNIKTDEEFTSLASEFEVTLAAYKKNKAAASENVSEDPSKVIKTAIASATVDPVKIPNSQVPLVQETIQDKANKAFSKEKITFSV